MYRLTQEEKERALKLLMEVLSIESVNGQSREADVAEYLDRYFKDTGYQTQIQAIDEKRSNFILDVPGSKSDRHVVWNGHLDTVPYGDLEAWTTDPSVPVLKEDKIYGRGTSDMKSGLCAMLYALHYLSEHGLVPEENVRFIGTSDEERGGIGAEEVLREELFGEPDFLLIGEPTNCQIGIAQKGCIWLEITARGKTSHGAYAWMGVNAAELGFTLCRQIKTIISYHHHPVLAQATAAITRVEGGLANNMIPDEVRFVMDIRSVPGMKHEDILKEVGRLQNLMEISYPGFKTEIKVLNERKPVELLTGNNRVRKLRHIIGEVCGGTPENRGINFFTDASVFLKDQYVPTLLFGPGSPALCHKPDEYVELARYYQAIEVFINLLME